MKHHRQKPKHPDVTPRRRMDRQRRMEEMGEPYGGESNARRMHVNVEDGFVVGMKADTPEGQAWLDEKIAAGEPFEVDVYDAEGMIGCGPEEIYGDDGVDPSI